MYNIIELKNICKKYKVYEGKEVKVFDGLSLDIHEADMFGIYGESGSGKTSLLNIIGLMDRCYTGEYKICEKEVSEILKDKGVAYYRNMKFGYVDQNYYLIPKLNVYDNIALPLMIRRKEKRIINTKVEEISEKMRIKDILYKQGDELSGGQRQRVCLARELIKEPDIFIADEPTSALDYKNKDNLLMTLNEINDEGKTIIIATHDENVLKCCNEVFEM